MFGISFEVAMIFLVAGIIGGLWHISTQLSKIVDLLHSILTKN
jgi:hypothetical protein